MPATLAMALTALTVSTSLGAQTPVDPPPWWGIADNDTVSLYWNFDNAAQPFVPTTAVVPAWFVPPPNNGFSPSAGITHLATLSGHTGVLGLNGPGIETIALEVDNDPRQNWLKIFWMQFDSYADSSSKVVAQVREDLAQYKRAIISEETESIGNGWERVTISCYLIPQPEWEVVDFELDAAAFESAAIDNLFVNSRCIKPPPDGDGDALGEPDGSLLNTDLSAATGNADAGAVAVTQDRNGAATFWVAGRNAAGSAQPVFRLDRAGNTIGPALTLPTATATQHGITDLTVAKLPLAGGRRDFVVGIADSRPTTGTVELLFIDAAGAAFAQARTIALRGLSGVPPLSIAFSQHGDLGAGTFWIGDQAGRIDEVTLDGRVLRTMTAANNAVPTRIQGLGYDELTGLLYVWSDAPRNTPRGALRVNGTVFSTYDLQPTGQQFFGNLSLAAPGESPGGTARGFEAVRMQDGDLQLLCVQRVGGRDFLASLNGPFQFGWSLLGRCGMAGDPPMVGSRNFQVTLTGVPRATFAMLYSGFSNRLSAGTPLPFSLGSLGLSENVQSISMELSSSMLAVQNGRVAHTIPLQQASASLQNATMFFQWLVFDPTLPGGIATSQAGKTLIY